MGARENRSGSEATPRAQLARRVLVDLTVMTVIGLVLAVVGPFGTYALPLAARIVGWLAMCWLGYAIYRPMGFFVNRLHDALALPRPALWAAACVVATVPMATLLYLLDRLPAPPAWPTLELAAGYYINVLVIGGGITAIMQLLGRNRGVASEAPAAVEEAVPVSIPEPEPPAALFLDRLPPALGTDLLALEMEDHYVRAHTAAGSDLVLMRMRDAVAELDGLDGAQVHRSWWVARDAVVGTRRDGRNVRLRLAGGLEAPVARGNVAELKERGWL